MNTVETLARAAMDAARLMNTVETLARAAMDAARLTDIAGVIRIDGSFGEPYVHVTQDFMERELGPIADDEWQPNGDSRTWQEVKRTINGVEFLALRTKGGK